MKIAVRNRCSDFNSYRAARVKSLFNCESGTNFSHDADLDIDDGKWQIGVVVGPSGSGKTSIGKMIFGDASALYESSGWAADKPIIDCINPGADFEAATGALAAVGLGSVPSWLRPYGVLSNGEKFRADLARVICAAPAQVVVDEFTSVVDRQIAKFGALAFAKAWRRTKGKVVLLSCHYDILDWIEPDWVYDTATSRFQRGSLWRRPKFELEIWETDRRYWHLFEPHYYLKLPSMIAATYYVGRVDGEPVCHLAVSPRLEMNAMRASRMVVMPEWQGAGIGIRFLNSICEMQTSGKGRFGDRVKAVYFHTSHPGFAAGLRRDKRWSQVSAELYGSRNKAKAVKYKEGNYGGHLRAIQGFKYARAA
ncbi:ABC_ATPase domain containing protein [uncultured Caudovirales phage]|uniref:ABC_ATPase domain containing protein n=1 Tax=uncultured Caudovirales phage TaxID=2100421 RepID=A0A6J5L7I1_9CAUD|nr:ABC_ATPase domain containing protein [uncultured Caudovirales phage]